MHLYHLAQAINPCTYLVDSPEGVDTVAVPEGGTVFIASGASTPEDLIFEVVRRLEARAAGAGSSDACGAAAAGGGTGRPSSGERT
jgi:4-hydroxy-3-methylbut-2-enyl diphosphate reductase IspH